MSWSQRLLGQQRDKRKKKYLMVSEHRICNQSLMTNFDKIIFSNIHLTIDSIHVLQPYQYIQKGNPIPQQEIHQQRRYFLKVAMNIFYEGSQFSALKLPINVQHYKGCLLGLTNQIQQLYRQMVKCKNWEVPVYKQFNRGNLIV